MGVGEGEGVELGVGEKVGVGEEVAGVVTVGRGVGVGEVVGVGVCDGVGVGVGVGDAELSSTETAYRVVPGKKDASRVNLSPPTSPRYVRYLSPYPNS